MARGKTLLKLLDDYRAEIRVSLAPSHNAQVRDTQVKLLQRVQDRLWEDFNWSHLRVRRSFLVQSGQRYYDTPEDLDIDRIEAFDVWRDDCWFPLKANIEAEHYATYNSDLDSRAYPPARWQITEGEQIELWPISDRNGDATTMDGTLRLTGIRRLNPLVADDDTADLDDRLIVLYAAAESLAATGGKDAQLKLDQANAHFRRLRNGLVPRRSFQMFGVGRRSPTPRGIVIGSYRPAVEP